MLLAVSEGFAVDYLFACVLIRMKNLSWTVYSLRNALTLLLTGSVIPFSLLPWGLGNILQYMPLGTLAGSVLAIYTGMGDVKMFAMLGLLYGMSNAYSLLICTTIPMAIVAIVLLASKKASRKSTMPMAPFTVFAFLIGVLSGM